MSDPLGTNPAPAREPPRRTDAEVLFTIAVKKKQLVYLIGLLGGVASPGAVALGKSCNAEDTAQAVAAITEDKTKTVDDQAGAAYEVWKRETTSIRGDISAVADRVNRLIDKVAVQEAALAGVLSKPDRARFRRSNRPTPAKVELDDKPPPPPTPEAAAAALPGGK